MPTQIEDWYNYPQYYDMAFRDETRQEADFFEAAFRKYCRFEVRKLLEPGCGSGRLVTEMAQRGYDVTGFDLSKPSLDYLRRRLSRRHLNAEVFEQDMSSFELQAPVDAAFNTFNTFRHLLTERAARGHLRSVSRHLRPGGLFILGFHILPLHVPEDCIERWTAKHGSTRVTVTWRVLKMDRVKRLEDIRVNLRVRSPGRDLKLRHDFAVRLYTASQFRRTLAAVPELELLDVFDFWYDIDEPLTFDEEITDTVFVLRKRGEPQ